MKKIVIALFAILGIAFIVIQFFQIDKTNPAVVTSETIAAVMPVPDNVDALIKRSCNDCHSNETKFPWYASIQPVGWWMKGHFDDGRRDLNFSQFATYQPKKQKKRLEQICDEITEGKMPLPSYLWGHSEARLSDADKKALCDWSNDAAQKIIVTE